MGLAAISIFNNNTSVSVADPGSGAFLTPDLQNKIIYFLVKFVATKKELKQIFFSPLSFVAVFGSGIWDPGWVKTRIQDP
jgi:uncharacterized membrane protein YpjA